MDLKDRDKLKTYFRKGQMPTQGHFEELIDSMVNRIDDGFSKDMDHGLMLSPEGGSRKLISFFRSIQDKNPGWSIDVDASDTQRGLCFGEPGPEGGVRLFIQQGGNVGINTVDPKWNLDVNGTAAMKSRVGMFAFGTIPADGKWHNIVEHLTGCNGFEVLARVGQTGQGRYALLHALAMSTYGRSHDHIRKLQAHYGWWWNKLRIRWSGDTFDYNLQVRTRRNYGNDIKVHYHVVKLWGDEDMGFQNTDKT